MHDIVLLHRLAERSCCPDQHTCPAPTQSMCSRASYIAPANDFLTALCALRPDVAAVLSGEAVAVARVDAQSPAHRCNRLNCSLYVIETEPPLDPPLTACSNPDCDRSIKAHA